MEKYIIRVYSINLYKKKINIKNFFKEFGSIKKFEKIILKNKSFEIILKIKIEVENLLKWKQYSNDKFKGLVFKFELKKYEKYNEENVTKKIFINKFPNKFNKADIFYSFKNFGKIQKIIVCNNNKNNCNFAFIYFYNKISSLNLLKEYSSHYINDIWVDIKIRKNNLNKKNKKKKINLNGKKIANDDFIINNKLTVFKLINQNKRSNSWKSLSNKNAIITKFNLMKNDLCSKVNTKIVKKRLIDDIISDICL